MERNTILAIIISAVLITGGMIATQMINERHAQENPVVPVTTPAETEAVSTEESDSVEMVSIGNAETDGIAHTLGEQNYPALTIQETTDNYDIEFSTVGGIVTSLFLTQQIDETGPVSMVMDGGSGVGTFNLAFGGPDAPYLDETFDHSRSRGANNSIIHTFTRDFQRDGQVFTLTKSYRLIPGEYLIEVKIGLSTPDGSAVPLLDGDQPAYTLTYGPQIGPVFDKIDGRYEIRENVSLANDGRNGKLKRTVWKDRSNFNQTGQLVNWAGVVGKYFAVIMTPGTGNTIISWDNRPADGQQDASRLQVSRPARNSSDIEDTYHYFIGPLDKDTIESYNDSTLNAFGVSGMNLQMAPRTSAALGWLEAILRIILEFFYRLIGNYGVAIILLTILVKLILFPFTHKSYESTGKMQAIQPKIKELQEQYKDKPQELNAKMAELYKEEGVNPMGGCLPMLFQFPIFIALYGLLNKYYPLRGAVFIPGWITDLSAPEAIVQFENGFGIFGMEFDAIRLLPVLYLAGQLLMTKVTQQGQAGAQSGMQQKMLTIGMPIMFFFILYNMPSGLLLYWTAMNLITIVQQLVTNSLKKRKAAGGGS